MIEGDQLAKGKRKASQKLDLRKLKKKKKSFLLFPKFFQKWSLIFIGLLPYWDS